MRPKNVITKIFQSLHNFISILEPVKPSDIVKPKKYSTWKKTSAVSNKRLKKFTRYKCAVPNCPRKNFKYEKEVSIHHFPKDEIIQNKWLNAIGKTKNEINFHREIICGIHFDQNLCIAIPKLGNQNIRPRLKKNAIPTLNLPINNQDLEPVQIPLFKKPGINRGDY